MWIRHRLDLYRGLMLRLLVTYISFIFKYNNGKNIRHNVCVRVVKRIFVINDGEKRYFSTLTLHIFVLPLRGSTFPLSSGLVYTSMRKTRSYQPVFLWRTNNEVFFFFFFLFFNLICSPLVVFLVFFEKNCLEEYFRNTRASPRRE